MNQNTYKSGMAMMSKLFGAKIDDEIINAYWNILKNLSDETFLKIQENIIKTFVPTSQVPFPLPAHFLNAAGISGAGRSRLSVQAILDASDNPGPYKTVSFGDLALHATIERFGGWPVVASWTLEDWQFKEKNFIAAYEANIASGEEGPIKLMGNFEYENSTKLIAGWNKEQMRMANNMAKPCLINWRGFDPMVGKLIENKTNDAPQIESQSDIIADLTKNIGRS